MKAIITVSVLDANGVPQSAPLDYEYGWSNSANTMPLVAQVSTTFEFTVDGLYYIYYRKIGTPWVREQVFIHLVRIPVNVVNEGNLVHWVNGTLQNAGSTISTVLKFDLLAVPTIRQTDFVLPNPNKKVAYLKINGEIYHEILSYTIANGVLKWRGGFDLEPDYVLSVYYLEYEKGAN